MSNTIDLYELAKHARRVGEIAIDGCKDVEKTKKVANVSFDEIHSHAVGMLHALAKAGHAKSHALLNPATGRAPEGGAKNPAVTGDSKATLSREAALAVGSIGI